MNNSLCWNEVIDLVGAELIRAKNLHPSWPADPIYAVAIIVEEAGEAMKEAIDLVIKEDKTARERLRTELVQTAAMAVRALIELE